MEGSWQDHSAMPKRLPMDCRKITAIHLTGLDDDELGMIAQRIEVQTQQLNRAMRMVMDVMSSRRRDL